MRGYVRAAGPQGVFLALGRDVSARVRLSNLADSFVDSPDKDFPVGKLVQGWVLRIDPARYAIGKAAATQLSHSCFDGACHHMAAQATYALPACESQKLCRVEITLRQQQRKAPTAGWDDLPEWLQEGATVQVIS